MRKKAYRRFDAEAFRLAAAHVLREGQPRGIEGWSAPSNELQRIARCLRGPVPEALLRLASDAERLTTDIERTEALHPVALRLRGAMAEALVHLALVAERLTAGIPPLTDLADYAGLLGPPWGGHPLRRRARLHGYKIHEPHLTKTLAVALTHDGIDARRTHAFLRALSAAAGLREKSMAPVSAPVTVEAEVSTGPTRRSKRIDLLFSWQDEEGSRLTVVEVKFGHSVQPGTLPVYRSYAKRRGADRFDLFLVTLWSDRLGNRNAEWRRVDWLDLLRRWESELAAIGDMDADFTGFRAELWKRAGERGNRHG